MSKQDTKYTFETGTGPAKQTAVITSRTKDGAIEKLCRELGVKQLGIEWRLTKFEIK